ncbi:NALCN channel auxiliary factor 1-like [Procambarus clarkii]|uniref:NALCN channel auxiliary factor 1-like n=1 Tax=Procambarus clarkii TaxID=6728 RepID=UPI003742AA69
MGDGPHPGPSGRDPSPGPSNSTDTGDSTTDDEGFHLVRGRSSRKRDKLRRQDEQQQQPQQQQQQQQQRRRQDEDSEWHTLIFPAGVMTASEKFRWIIEAARAHREVYRIDSRCVGGNVSARVQGHRALKFFTENSLEYQVEYLEDCEETVWVRRNTGPEGLPKNQTITLCKGDLPPVIKLSGMMACKVERYIGSPSLCGNCQRWDHRTWQCDRPTRCECCSGSHDTKQCLAKLTPGEGGGVMPKCVNCKQPPTIPGTDIAP